MMKQTPKDESNWPVASTKGKLLPGELEALVAPLADVHNQEIIADFEPGWLELMRDSYPFVHNYPYSFSREEDLGEKPEEGKLLVVHASRADGYNMIRSLFMESDLEHTWIYIPKVDLWIDDTFTAKDTHVGGDPALRAFLAEHFSTLELVHTHPDPIMHRLFQEGTRSEAFLLEGATPTSGDLISLVQQIAQSNRETLFRGAIASHFGVTVYELSPDNLREGEGGECASFWGKVHSETDPTTEIRRMLYEQQQSMKMSQFEDYRPSHLLSFEPYESFK